MLAIKLKRIGKKHQVSFRLVVVEKRSKLQGRFVEDLGWANPRTDERRINAERVSHWMKVGAQPTPTVWNLLVKAGAVRGKKIAVHGKSKQSASIETAPNQKAETAVPDAPAQEIKPAPAGMPPATQ
jgi:small subunit ribosomal protein S16